LEPINGFPRYLVCIAMAGTAFLASVVQRRLAATLQAPTFQRSLVLGLDVSTRAVGMAVLNGRGELVATEVLTGDGTEHSFAMAAAVSERVHQLASELGSNDGSGSGSGGGSAGFSHVAVEDVLKSFATGRFQTQGLFTLARLNGMVCYEMWRRTGASVASVMPNAVRATFDIKSWTGVPPIMLPSSPLPGDTADGGTAAKTARQRKPDDPTKVAVMAYVSRAHVDLPHTWTLTRTGSLAVTNYDRCDAVLTAMYGWAQHLQAAMFRGSTPHEVVELVRAHALDLKGSKAAAALAAVQEPHVQALLSDSPPAAVNDAVQQAISVLQKRWQQQVDADWGVETAQVAPQAQAVATTSAAGEDTSAPAAVEGEQRSKRLPRPIAAAVTALEPVYAGMAKAAWPLCLDSILRGDQRISAAPLVPAWACRPPWTPADAAADRRPAKPRARKAAAKPS